MTEVEGARTTVIQINADQFNQLLQKIDNQTSKIDRLEKRMGLLEKFPWLGDWITAKEAMQVLSIDDSRTLSKWVKRGVIESKVVAENGNRKQYSKADVLAFAANAEKYLKGH